MCGVIISIFSSKERLFNHEQFNIHDQHTIYYRRH
jgi:hypothetical protein